jgi:hypothetical protein
VFDRFEPVTVGITVFDRGKKDTAMLCCSLSQRSRKICDIVMVLLEWSGGDGVYSPLPSEL